MGTQKRRTDSTRSDGLARLVVAIASVAAIGCAACGGAQKSTNTPAVNVSGLVFQDLDGEEVLLAKLRSKIIVLHLFTTWSVASQVDVEKLQKQHKKGDVDVVVIGVALDPDGAKLVRPWSKGMSTEYPIVLSSAQLRDGKSVLGRIRTVPTTLVINRFGRVRNRVERQLKAQELPRLVEAARRAR